ncbi:Rho- BTB domain-containing protein 1 [Balamuthia mandrillaris]
MQKKRKQGKNKKSQPGQPDGRDVWAVIPWDLVYKIWVEHLEPADVPAIALVCRSWSELSLNHDIWKAWYTLRFGQVEAPPGEMAREEDYRQLFRATAMTNPVHTAKVVVVGEARCLKSKLCERIAFGTVRAGYLPTVFNSFVAPATTTSGHKINVYLQDTPGEEDYDRLRPLCYVGADVALLCCRGGRSTEAITTQNNINARWTPEIMHHLPNISIINVVLCDDDADREPPSGLSNPLICNIATGEGVDALLQQVVETHMANWRRSHRKNKAGGLRIFHNLLSKKSKKTSGKFLPKDLRGFINLKPEYTMTTNNGQQVALEFLADPKQCIRDIGASSATYCGKFVSQGYPFVQKQDWNLEIAKEAANLPQELRDQTVDYVTLLYEWDARVVDNVAASAIVEAACSQLVEGNKAHLEKNSSVTKLLIEMLSFIIQFDTSNAPEKITNALAAAVSSNIHGLLQDRSKSGQTPPGADTIYNLTFRLTHSKPLFTCLTPTFTGPLLSKGEDTSKHATLMAALANLCEAMLQQNEIKLSRTDVYCRAMTAAILFHSKCNQDTFSVKKSAIHIEQCLQTLASLHQYKLLDVILHSIHDQWQNCSATVKELLLWNHTMAED